MTSTMDAHADGGRRHPCRFCTRLRSRAAACSSSTCGTPPGVEVARFAEEQFPDGGQEELGPFEPQFLPVVNLITTRTRASV